VVGSHSIFVDIAGEIIANMANMGWLIPPVSKQ
jgi:hypothetical protein